MNAYPHNGSYLTGTYDSYYNQSYKWNYSDSSVKTYRSTKECSYCGTEIPWLNWFECVTCHNINCDRCVFVPEKDLKYITGVEDVDKIIFGLIGLNCKCGCGGKQTAKQPEDKSGCVIQ